MLFDFKAEYETEANVMAIVIQIALQSAVQID